MYILIPSQTQSTRVPLKNIRPFFKNDSLLSIKLKQLLKVFPSEKIYVSSEDERVKKITEEYGCNYIPRPMSLTGNNILQGDLIGNMLSHLPKDSEDIMWVQVTQPLFDCFDEIIKCWNEKKKEGFDGLVAVKTVRHHIVSEKGIPINFNFGCWHKVSQKLPKCYEILWSAFVQTRESIETTKYQISKNPYYMPFDNIQTVDIDTIEDFNLASKLYSEQIEL